MRCLSIMILQAIFVLDDEDLRQRCSKKREESSIVYLKASRILRRRHCEGVAPITILANLVKERSESTTSCYDGVSSHKIVAFV